MNLRCVLVFVALVLGAIAMAQTSITVDVEGDAVLVRGDARLRYAADYRALTVELSGAVLAEPPSRAGQRFEVRQSEAGVTFVFAEPFFVTLSASERELVIAPANRLAGAPERIGNDERAPVLYPLSNARASDVAALIASLYPSLQVEVDARQRAVLILLNEQDRELVDALVERLDAPRPQVMFEAEILEINQDITQSLGISYDSIFTFNLTEATPSGLLALGAVGRSPFSLSFGLNLLKTNGAADVLARPRVTTLDGVQAQLNATQTVPVIVPGANGKESVQNITTGITLRMLPRISPDGTVEADLSISVSTPTGTTSQGVPQFSSRDATTTVRVRNGEPIAIGGLIERREIEGVQKVPLLGDIPILGELFTSRRTEQRRTDLVIIVTPRIIAPGEYASPAALGVPATDPEGGVSGSPDGEE